MKISFINDGIFESYKSLVERREFSYIYICVCVCVWGGGGNKISYKIGCSLRLHPYSIK